MEYIICPEKWRTVTKDNIVERREIYDWLQILDEVNSAFMYLIIGKERALLFDTGYGFAPLWPLIREATDLPLTVVCSHGHDDHVLGCWQFDEAYIHEEDLALALSNDNDEQKWKQILSRRKKTPDIEELVDFESYKKQNLQGCTFHSVKGGDVFDLGGLTLVVYPIPGHTRGSIGLYCPEHRALFSGDSMLREHRIVYAQSLKTSAAPQDFIRALTALEKLDIESVWPAHGSVPADKSLITEMREMLIDFAHNGSVENDQIKNPEPGNVFRDPTKPICIYRYAGVEMAYHPGHLEQIREYMKEHDGAVE